VLAWGLELDAPARICDPRSAKLKINFEGNLCYLTFSMTIGLQKAELFQERPADERFQNPFSTEVAKAAAQFGLRSGL
jgi:hypothetical protein